jgi:tape measure domain-containing protein
MTTENIDIVLRSGGTRRVVRDLNEIADAADRTESRVSRLQAQLNRINTSSFQRQLNALQGSIAGLGQNTALTAFQQQLAAVTTQLAQMNQQLAAGVGHANRAQAAQHGFLGSLRSVRTAINGVLALLAVRQILEWADAWIVAAGKILIFSRSQQEAAEIMDRIYKISQEVRTPLGSLAQLYTRLAISSRELGISQKEMLGFTEMVGKIFAIQGTGMMQARGALLQLSQAMGEGIVRGQEFNSLLENAPLLLDIVAKHLKAAGGSVAQLRRIMLDGKLTSKDFFEALMKGQAEVEEMFKNAPKTFGQGFIVLVNAIERYLGKLNEAFGLSEKFFAMTSLIGNNLDAIGKSLLAIGAGLAVAFAPALLTAVLGGLGAIALAVRAITVALLANPFAVLVGAAIAAYAFADSINVGIDGVTMLSDVIKAVGPEATEWFTSIGASISEFFSGFAHWAKDTFGSFGDWLAAWIPGWLQQFSAFYSDVGTGFDGVVRALAKTADAIGGLLLGMGTAVIRVLGGMPAAIDQIGKQMFNAIVGSIENIINTAIAGVNKLWSIVGKGTIDAIKLERAKVDTQYFKKYGQNIASSIDDGFSMQGNFLLNSVNRVFDRAAEIAKVRTFEAEARAKQLESSMNKKMGGGADAATGKKGNQRALNQAAKDAQGEIREMLDRYKVGTQEMTELERHKEVMLKASYDMGLLNYSEYSNQLKALQDANFERQRTELLSQQKLIEDKMDELRQKLQAKGVSAVQINNVMQDMETKLRGVNLELEKLGNKNEERLAQSLAQALKPAREITEHAERELVLMQLNTQQAFENYRIKTAGAQLSEKELFIQEELNKLLNIYEDKLQKLQTVFEQMSRDGIFDDLSNPAVRQNFDALQKAMQDIRDSMTKLREEGPKILGDIFDQAEAAKFARTLNSSIVDALFNAGKEGSASLRAFLTDALKKPFKIVVEAALKPFTNAISSVVMGGMNAIANGFMKMLGFIGGSGGGGDTVGNNVSAFVSGGSSVGNVAGLAGSLGAFGSYATTGFMNTIAGGAGFFGNMSAGLSAGTSLMSGGAVAEGLGMIAGTLGPIAVGLMAIAAIAKNTKGETRGGGQYAADGGGAYFWRGPSGGDPNQATGIASVDATQKSINETLKALGVNASVAGFQAGYESSTKGRGGVMAGGLLSTGQMFGEDRAGSNYAGTFFERTSSQSPSMEEAFANFQTDLKQVQIQALQAAAGLAGPGAGGQASGHWESVTSLVNTMMPGGPGGNDWYSQIREVTKQVWIEGATNAIGNIQSAGNFPRIIRDLLVGIDAEALSDDDAEKLLLKINEIIKAVQGFRQIVDASPFEDLKNRSFDSAAGLIALSGGLDALARGLSDYYDNFYSEEEKRANTIKNITSTLNKAGIQFSEDQIRSAIENPNAKAIFRSWVESSMAMGEAGDQSTAALLSVAGAFAGLIEAAEAAVDPLEGLSEARDNLTRAYEKEKSELEGVQSRMESLAKTFSQFKETLLLGDLSPSTPGQKYADARRIYDETINDAQSGNREKAFAAAERFTSVSTALLEASRTFNASGANYQSDFNMVLGNTLTMTTVAQEQYAIATQQLAALDQSVSGLIEVRDAVLSVREAIIALNAYGPAAQLPGHAGGLARVPYDNYVFRAHKDEAVLTSSEARIWRSGASASGNVSFDLSALLARIDTLTQEVCELRDQQAESVNAEIAAIMAAARENATVVTDGVAGSTERAAWIQSKRDGARFE